MFGWHPLKSEGIVKQEDLDTGRGAFRENLAESVGDSTVLADIQLESDRLARRTEIAPELRERAISIEGNHNLARREEGSPREHGDAERELGLSGRDGSAIGSDAVDMPHGSTAGYVLNADQRGKSEGAHERPPAKPRQRRAHTRPDTWDAPRTRSSGGSRVWR